MGGQLQSTSAATVGIISALIAGCAIQYAFAGGGHPQLTTRESKLAKGEARSLVCQAEQVELAPGGAWYTLGPHPASATSKLEVMALARPLEIYDWTVLPPGQPVAKLATNLALESQVWDSRIVVFRSLETSASFNEAILADKGWHIKKIDGVLGSISLPQDSVYFSLSKIPKEVVAAWPMALASEPSKRTPEGEFGKNFFFGENKSFFTERLPNGEYWVKLLGGGYPTIGRISPEISPLSFPRLRLGYLGDGQPVLTSLGLLAPLNKGIFEPIPTPLYARVAQTGVEGKVRLLHSPSQVIAVDTSIRGEADAINIGPLAEWLKHGWTISSLAFDPASKRSAMLLRGGDRLDRALVLQEPNSLPRVSVCQSNETNVKVYQGNQVVTPLYQREFFDGPTENWKLGLWHIKGKKTGKGTIIRFRGGPTDSVFQQDIGDIVKPLLDRGYTYLSVDYSGSRNTNPNVYTRLREDPFRALNRDASEIVKFLEVQKLQKPYIIIAESFGALPAAAVAQHSPDLISQFHLAFPFGKYVPPPEISGESSIDELSQFDYAVKDAYGGPSRLDPKAQDDFNSEMNRQLSGLCFTPAVNLYFGAMDPKVRPEHWETGCLRTIQRETFPQTGHYYSDSVINAILERIP
ncbi:MAG: hypothetical protein O9270_17425 [Aquidulcibacter sp.]|jgi:pimeloyl-ACP methyl ester carboxylesterase|uniref:hypothetical protein n=1 Tax=Aquidulcibacter sp. TaxID=2052990 RepID=UPI0022BE88B6|nr:hypothetical protein [Aquidulcibacter sp.]MCZ8209963.1 hypothetical protein [Aquidulcibacter sp.]